MEKIIYLRALNAALNPQGWYAEFSNTTPEDFTIAMFQSQGGLAIKRFEFDPADTDDNGPWDDEGAVHGFPIDAEGVEHELFALCKACQADDEPDTDPVAETPVTPSISIETAGDFIRLAMDPNVTVTATGEMLRAARRILDDQMDEAEKLPSVDLVKAFLRLSVIYTRLATVATDGSRKAGDEQGILTRRVDAVSSARAALLVARRLMTDAQQSELNRILVAANGD